MEPPSPARPVGPATRRPSYSSGVNIATVHRVYGPLPPFKIAPYTPANARLNEGVRRQLCSTGFAVGKSLQSHGSILVQGGHAGDLAPSRITAMRAFTLARHPILWRTVINDFDAYSACFE